MKNAKLSIIIPAYNEEERIGITLEEYGKFLTNLNKEGNLDCEILVVINNTKDKTEEVVKEYKRKYKFINYLNLNQGGKGFAIIEGFKDALKRDIDLMGFVDADMATPPKAFYDLILNIKNYDGIIASRRLSGSNVKGKTLLGVIKSSLFNFAVRGLLVLPYRDTQCGAKLFRKKPIESVINNIGITKWAFDVDLLYKINKKGYRIKEIPTFWEEKQGSKHDIVKASLKMFSAVLRLRLLNSPFRFIIKAYEKLPEGIKLNHRILT